MSRRDSRIYAMGVAYRKELGTQDEPTILDEEPQEADREFAEALLRHLDASQEAYREAIQGLLKDWTFQRLGYLERSILLLGFAELENFSEIPLKASLDEWEDLAKSYCGQEAKKLVNGVLNQYKNQLVREGRRSE